MSVQVNNGPRSASCKSFQIIFDNNNDNNDVDDDDNNNNTVQRRVSRAVNKVVEVKGKGRPVTCHAGTEGRQKFSTTVLEGGGWSAP